LITNFARRSRPPARTPTTRPFSFQSARGQRLRVHPPFVEHESAAQALGLEAGDDLKTRLRRKAQMRAAVLHRLEAIILF
jgi:hypothetical protein